MKLEEQVITLEQAKRLKELGVRQKSLFYHRETLNGWAISFKDDDVNFITGMIEPDTVLEGDEEQCFSAFTVAELGVMLKNCISGSYNYTTDKDMFYATIDEYHNYALDNLEKDESWYFEALTEAEARAKLLIHLLEEKIIPVEQINKP